MEYSEIISSLLKRVGETVSDFELVYKRKNAPTAASSEFLTNKAQGDWAEQLVMDAINQSNDLIAVHYGRSDDLVAGEDGFEQFYIDYQDELERIGKRPDILIFNKKDYNNKWGSDISDFSEELLDGIVPKAIAGLEVRSSSFLIEKYEKYQDDRKERLNEEIKLICSVLLNEYKEILGEKGEGWLNVIEHIQNNSPDDLVILPRSPAWRVGEAAIVSEYVKKLRLLIKEYQKRDFLSITPKAEDLAVVCTWIQKYNVPHFYLQVFFDNIYAISFYDILKMLLDPSREKHDFLLRATQRTKIKQL